MAKDKSAKAPQSRRVGRDWREEVALLFAKAGRMDVPGLLSALAALITVVVLGNMASSGAPSFVFVLAHLLAAACAVATILRWPSRMESASLGAVVCLFVGLIGIASLMLYGVAMLFAAILLFVAASLLRREARPDVDERSVCPDRGDR